MDIKRRDAGERPLLIVQSVPLGRGWTQAGPFTIPAGTTTNFFITTIPDSDLLGLWDFLLSFRVDTNDSDHRFPGGGSLSSGQKKFRLNQWIDFEESSDISNQRVHRINMENYDSASHDVWILYKAYTFASVGG